MKKLNNVLNLILPLTGIIAIILIWSISAFTLKDEIVLPSVIDTLKGTFNLFLDDYFYLAFFGTLLRTLIAFLVAFLVATVLSILTTKFIRAKKIVAPIIAIIRAFPTIAMVLWVSLFTPATIAPMIVTGVVVLPTLYSSVSQAFLDIDGDLVKMCRLYNVQEKTILKKVILPPLLPKFAEICGSGFALNLKLMVAAEIIAETGKSLGILMRTKKVYFETAELLALVIIVIVTAIVIEKLFLLLAKGVKKWQTS